MFLIDRSINPGSDVGGKVGPLSHFVDWLARQDPDTKYDFNCTDGTCLIGLYMAEHGLGALNYYEQTSMFPSLPGRLASAQELIAAREPWTFGAALSRAHLLQATERERL